MVILHLEFKGLGGAKGGLSGREVEKTGAEENQEKLHLQRRGGGKELGGFENYLELGQASGTWGT